MTEFLSSYATHQLLPPWQSRNMRLWAFVIRAERERIQHHLDRNFNSGGPDVAPFRYVALPGPSFGVLAVIDHPHFSGATWKPEARVEQDGFDRVAHKEVCWAFPALRYRVSPDSLLYDETQVWIQPFAFDNSEYVVFSAREMWGSETEYAEIRMFEQATAGTMRADVAIEGLVTFSPESQSHKIGCLRATVKEGARQHERIRKEKGLGHFLRLLEHIVGDPTRSMNQDGKDEQDGAMPAEAEEQHGIEINTLKQFRDVFDFNAAAYRAITSSMTVLTGVEDLRIFEGDDAVVEFFCSDTIKETLVRLFGDRRREGPSALPDMVPPLHPEEPRVDWKVPLFPLDVAAVVSCTADARYSTGGTLHVYGKNL